MVKILYITSIMNSPYEISPSHTFLCKARTREGMKQGSGLERLLSPALMSTDFKGESHPGFP